MDISKQQHSFHPSSSGSGSTAATNLSKRTHTSTTTHTSSLSSQALSHTRTNSSSSSASSVLNSPIYADTSNLMFNNFSSAYNVNHAAYSDKTPSEAAALAAVKAKTHHNQHNHNLSHQPSTQGQHNQNVHTHPTQYSHQNYHPATAGSKIVTPSFHHSKGVNRSHSYSPGGTARQGTNTASPGHTSYNGIPNTLVSANETRPAGASSPPVRYSSAAANAVFGAPSPMLTSPVSTKIKGPKESKLATKANKLFGRPIKNVGVPSSSSKANSKGKVSATSGAKRAPGAVVNGAATKSITSGSIASGPNGNTCPTTSVGVGHHTGTNSASATVSQVLNHINHIGAPVPLSGMSDRTGSMGSMTGAALPRTSSSSARKLKHDLTIQTSLSGKSSLSEKSPLSRPSREMDRIASIPSSLGDSSFLTAPGSASISGSYVTGSNPETSSIIGVSGGSLSTGPGGSSSYYFDSTSGTATPSGSDLPSKLKPHSKHHLSFRNRKESYGLSSSASNSKLVFAEQGSIYSFHPSSPGVTVSPVELRSLPREERDQVLDGSWSLLQTKVLPLFSGEDIRVPVEDLNNLLSMHISVATQSNGTTAHDTLLGETRALLTQGMQLLAAHTDLMRVPTFSPGSKTTPASFVQRLVSVWQHAILDKIAPYMEAVFLPLVIELDYSINTRNIVLETFRDVVIIPLIDVLKEIISKPLQFDALGSGLAASPLSPSFSSLKGDVAAPSPSSSVSTTTPIINLTQTAAGLFQCVNILGLLQTSDTNQTEIDCLSKLVKTSWISLPRQGKDRRGFVAAGSGSGSGSKRPHSTPVMGSSPGGAFSPFVTPSPS